MTRPLASGASRLALILVAGMAMGALSACDRNAAQSPDQVAAPEAAMALTTGPARPLRYAPPAQALPEVAPISYAEPPRGYDDGYYYRYLDDADYMTTAFFDGPPDYTFDYDGVYPWVWRADDSALALVEPIDRGYRYYYYHPGEDYPFLVTDPDYSYAYNDGALITVFDTFGRTVPRFEYVQRAPIAARYLQRGRGLFQAARGPNRQPVNQNAWLSRRAQVSAISDTWRRDRERVDAWKAFSAQHAPQQQARWAPERYRREAAASRFFQKINDPAASQRHWQQALQARTVAAQPKTLPQSAGFRAFNRRENTPAVQPGAPQPGPLQPSAQAARAEAAQARGAEMQARQEARAQRQVAQQPGVQAQAHARAEAQAQGQARAQAEAQMRAERQASQQQAVAAHNAQHAAEANARMLARQAQQQAGMQARAQQRAANAEARAQVQAQHREAAQAQAHQAARVVIQPQRAQPQPPRQGGGQHQQPQGGGQEKEKDKHH